MGLIEILDDKNTIYLKGDKNMVLMEKGIKNTNPANANLLKAKKAKNDEFYTRYEDIEVEVMEYKEQFQDKIVSKNFKIS